MWEEPAREGTRLRARERKGRKKQVCSVYRVQRGASRSKAAWLESLGRSERGHGKNFDRKRKMKKKKTTRGVRRWVRYLG